MKPMFRLVQWICIALLFIAPAFDSFAQDPSWATLNASGNPSERHENGFVSYGGKLYLLGGRNVKPVQIYDPATNTWTTGASPPFQMHHFQAVVFNDLIYVIGAYTGVCCSGEFGISNVWTYNPQTDTWNEGDEIPADRRRGSTGAVVYNNKIYIIGGLQGGHGPGSTSYNWFDEYDPATGEWRVMPNAPHKRDHYHAVLFNNKIYLTSGRDTSHESFVNDTVSEVDVFDFSTGSWSTLSATIPTARGGAASILYRGEILVIGGETNQDLAHNETEAFNPSTQSWSTLSDLVVGRHGTQAALLDDALYIAAGAATKGGELELNSIERYQGESTGLSSFAQSLKRNWNLLSLPLTPTDGFYTSIYNNVPLDGLTPFTWNGSDYVSTTELAPGDAFWLKLSGSANSPSQTILGTPVNELQYSLTQGWNLLATPSCNNIAIFSSSTFPTGAVAEGLTYHYDTGGYQPAFSFSFPRGLLNQGKGYWVYAITNATLNLTCGSGKQASQETGTLEDLSSSFGSITVRDARSGFQTLYFGNTLQRQEEAISYKLPPKGPEGDFDVRYTNDTRLTQESNAVVRINYATFPLSVSFDDTPAKKEGVLFIDEMNQAGTVIHTHQLSESQSIQIFDSNISYLNIRFEESLKEDVPMQFSLHGNYPNPFNPTTRITFDIPERGDLTLRVVDMLGREVYSNTYLGLEPSSNQSISFEANDLPAGMYVYVLSLQTGNQLLTQSGRMTLLK